MEQNARILSDPITLVDADADMHTNHELSAKRDIDIDSLTKTYMILKKSLRKCGR